jgi:hypothetical protein
MHNNPLTVVGTADGLIHGFDAANNIQWSAETGGPTASFYSSGNLDFAVIPSTDGSLLVNTADGMRKTSVKARMLVEKAPFSSPEGLIFTSQKKSRVIGVDLANGKVLHDLPSEERFRFATKKESNRRARKNDPLWVGRTDYIFRAFDHITGTEEFNFTYSEIHPMSRGSNVSPETSNNAGNELAPLDGLKKLPITVARPIISTPEGYLYFFDGDGTAHRGHFLSAPAITAFHVQKSDEVTTGSVRPYESYNVRPVKVALRMSFGRQRQRSVNDRSDSNERVSASENDNIVDDSEDAQVVLVQSLSDGSVYGVEVGATDQQQTMALSPRSPPPVTNINLRQQQLADDSSASSERGKSKMPVEGEDVTLFGKREDALRLGARTSSVGHPLYRQSAQKPPHHAMRLHPALASKASTVSPTTSMPTQLLNKNQFLFPSSQSESDDEDSATSQLVRTTGSQIISVGRILTDAASSPGDLKSANRRAQNADQFPIVKVGDNDKFWESSPSLTFADFLYNYVDESATPPAGPPWGEQQPMERIVSQTLSLRQRIFFQVVHWLHIVETIILRVLLFVFLVIVMLFTVIQQGLPLPTIIRSIVEVTLAQVERLFLPNRLSLGLIDNKLSIFSSSIDAGSAIYDEHASDEEIVNHESGCAVTKVGSLLISSEVLGYGSHGTMVFKGSLNGRPVAVKRMLSRFDRAAERYVQCNHASMQPAYPRQYHFFASLPATSEKYRCLSGVTAILMSFGTFCGKQGRSLSTWLCSSVE